ncbi:adenylosuccinate synthetase [Oleiphilus messinensis]|uniref:adenylosuccinate synthetase n=1 Tax=Oleiphilus messinensis TaxID=141451 RepID=UPI0012F92F4D|nr:adenylosuccinate synthetase [Oleiphilus messinensis]
MRRSVVLDQIKAVEMVIDLGFGDSGKGVMVDYLCAQNPERSLVVRFSGGHQVGHTVWFEGKRHIFSHFGSGTFRGVPTYYTAQTTFFPPGMLMERQRLTEYNPVLYLDPQVMVTTPYDIAFNRALEQQNAHGSCGVGFGATVERHDDGVPLFAQDLQYAWVVQQKLNGIADYYQRRVSALEPKIQDAYRTELNGYEDDQYIDVCLEATQWIQVRRFDQCVCDVDRLVFEGSQGVLLDQSHGFFPHVTRSYTTSRNAFSFLEQFQVQAQQITLNYLTRCYQTRHGNGPMSSENNVVLVNNEHEANQHNFYQGAFRCGALDSALLNYALDCDRNYHPWPSVQNRLVISCLDQLPEFDIGKLLGELTVSFDEVMGNVSPYSESLGVIQSPRIK